MGLHGTQCVNVYWYYIATSSYRPISLPLLTGDTVSQTLADPGGQSGHGPLCEIVMAVGFLFLCWPSALTAPSPSYIHSWIRQSALRQCSKNSTEVMFRYFTCKSELWNCRALIAHHDRFALCNRLGRSGRGNWLRICRVTWALLVYTAYVHNFTGWLSLNVKEWPPRLVLQHSVVTSTVMLSIDASP
jgi:hypothetical protein